MDAGKVFVLLLSAFAIGITPIPTGIPFSTRV